MLGSVIALVLVSRQSKTVVMIIPLFKSHALLSRAKVLSILRRLQIKSKKSYLGSLNRTAANIIPHFAREEPKGSNARCDTGPINYYI